MPALVLGSAATVFADAEAALKVFTPTVVAACNNIGIDWEGRVHHWFTLHPAKTEDWPGIQEAKRRRRLAKRNTDIVTWSFKAAKGIDRVTEDWGGSTGLLAVKGLLEIGFGKIVLAGVPMTILAGHYNQKPEWRKAEMYHRGWHKHLKEIAPFVRSMSGWTQKLLGAPTKQWLAEPVSRRALCESQNGV
jgi:hypothetical protein